MATEPLLSLRAIAFRPNGRTVLDSIDFEWRDGVRTCALIGPNGAGKTVMLRTIHGLLEPDSGEVRFEGRPPPDKGFSFEGQALVFQHPSLFRGSTLDNLLLVPDSAGRGRRSSCLGASASDWRSRAPGSPNRGCCCSTSPPPASTRRPPTRSSN